METLTINIKNKKDSKLIKDLLQRLNVGIDSHTQGEKNKFKSEKEFKSLAGIVKGQLISKANIRSIAWKNRNW